MYDRIHRSHQPGVYLTREPKLKLGQVSGVDLEILVVDFETPGY
jgi:hypothetical protein